MIYIINLGIWRRKIYFYRAREEDSKYIKNEKSLIHNTALIACKRNNVIGSLEYMINDIEEAEIINFDIYKQDNKELVFKGLIEELISWNPYLKRIIYNENNNFIKDYILMDAGFKKESIWICDVINDIEVFKINIEDIIVEQLTVSESKVNKVSSWIDKPEDIIIACVEIENKIVCIDGYSRLVVAYNKGFKYVYGYLEMDRNLEFYKTCMECCREENIFTIKDLEKRVVSEKEHQRLWIDKCQAYFNENKNIY